MSFTAADAGPRTGTLALLPGILAGAAGMGLVVAPIAQLTLTDLASSEAGTGSGLFNTVSQLGAAIGVATIGTLFFTQLHHDSAGHHAAAAYGHAFSWTLWISAGLLIVAFAVSCVLPQRTVPTPAATGSQPPAEPADSAKSPTTK
jgi:MFS family permease